MARRPGACLFKTWANSFSATAGVVAQNAVLRVYDRTFTIATQDNSQRRALGLVADKRVSEDFQLAVISFRYQSSLANRAPRSAPDAGCFSGDASQNIESSTEMRKKCEAF
jgi:hypothetical protein